MSKALVLIILPLVLGCAHALAQDTVQIVSTAPIQQVRTKPAPMADAQQITDEQICRMRIAAYKNNYTTALARAHTAPRPMAVSVAATAPIPKRAEIRADMLPGGLHTRDDHADPCQPVSMSPLREYLADLNGYRGEIPPRTTDPTYTAPSLVCSRLGGVRDMTSDSDDLEEALRQNQKLRHELAAEVAKTWGVVSPAREAEG